MDAAADVEYMREWVFAIREARWDMETALRECEAALFLLDDRVRETRHDYVQRDG